MKRLLLLLALSGTVVANAQHFELGLDGSAMHYRCGPKFVNWPTTIAPGASLKAMYSTKHYEAGVDFGYQVANFKWTGQMGGSICYVVTPGAVFTPSMPPYIKNKITSTLITDKIFFNRKVSLGRMEEYGGLSLGQLLQKDKRWPTPDDGSGNGTRSNQARIVAGVQMGIVYPVTKRIGINAQVEADCDYFHWPVPQTVINAFTFPVSMGVRYRL